LQEGFEGSFDSLRRVLPYSSQVEILRWESRRQILEFQPERARLRAASTAAEQHAGMRHKYMENNGLFAYVRLAEKRSSNVK